MYESGLQVRNVSFSFYNSFCARQHTLHLVDVQECPQFIRLYKFKKSNVLT